VSNSAFGSLRPVSMNRKSWCAFSWKKNAPTSQVSGLLEVFEAWRSSS